MPAGNVYRIDPPPVQRIPRVPPEAHVQGDQPPPKPARVLYYIQAAWSEPFYVVLHAQPINAEPGDEPPRKSHVLLHSILHTWQPAPIQSRIQAQRFSRLVVEGVPPVIPDQPYTRLSWNTLRIWYAEPARIMSQRRSLNKFTESGAPPVPDDDGVLSHILRFILFKR